MELQKEKMDTLNFTCNHDLKEVDHVSESNDEQPIDDFEILQTKLNNMDEQAFDNELGTEGDKKDGENSCGTRKRRKRMWIKDLCLKHNVHFLGIQESKMTRLELFRIKSMWGNYAFDYACSMARGLSGGLISIWDPNISWFPKLPYGIDSRLDASTIMAPIVMFGDMNRVRNAQERFGTTLNSIEADHFNSFIDSTGLVDLPIGGRSFTWDDKARCG
ncbi:RNA-directed DNA polymerase, eukaryota, reverse transcriptase zinc-binding domain protein [Tanacetum coccineum]|uniref:RNA-directed DNA polymerase, eukaryota, reverse transcriptase zinc-binding domain protein n=1 Tax=Tanacetum coccineum TaxID=301880 RepID=A0ABQ5IC76_9ASTR